MSVAYSGSTEVGHVYEQIIGIESKLSFMGSSELDDLRSMLDYVSREFDVTTRPLFQAVIGLIDEQKGDRAALSLLRSGKINEEQWRDYLRRKGGK